LAIGNPQEKLQFGILNFEFRLFFAKFGQVNKKGWSKG